RRSRGREAGPGGTAAPCRRANGRDGRQNGVPGEPVVIEINPRSPEPRKIRRAAEALRAGKLVAYPTDTCYGLGCDLFNKRALGRLYQVKSRPKTHQLSFVCRDIASIAKYAMLHNYEYGIVKEYLPGPYCFILNATREVPRVVQTSRKQVGIRVP